MHADLTPAQARTLDLFKKLGTVTAVAREMKVHRSTVQDALRACSFKGAAEGLIRAPNVPGMSICKTTVQMDAEGNLEREWRRLVPDMEHVERWVRSLEDRVRRKGPKFSRRSLPTDPDLLLEIPIPDLHLGMLAWDKETGHDYDCKIAAQLCIGGVKSVLSECPAPGKVLLVVPGDYFHSDSRTGMTERAGNVLDTDSRFAKRADIGIETMCQCIELCASAAPLVEVVVLSGNHDWHSAKWLSRVLAAYYNSSDRVHVSTDPAPRYHYRHGKVLLSYMHGDTMKAEQFARVIPAEASKHWAKTEFRYGRVAHWHHRVTQEFPGVVIETLPTLAAPDAWAHDHGMLSRRAITACLWSARWGLRSKMERSPAEILSRR